MPTIRRIASADSALIPELSALLQNVVHGGASVGFLAPVSSETATRYWTEAFALLDSALHLWIAEEEGAVIGTVQLAPCMKENGRHRADLQKLLVHSRYRGRGIAKDLIATAEMFAATLDISLLVLDTLRGSTAESMYAHLGWSRAGEIPQFAASPDGELHPTVYFYRRMAR